MALNGIDIASYQGDLNLDNVSYDFVCIKATEGNNYVNPSCDTHYQEAKTAGKKRAVYHFYDFTVDPITQANYFVDNCLGYIGEAIFVLDWEGSNVDQVSNALAFLQQVEARIGYKPAIYMSEYVENSYDWSSVVNGNYGLWAAKYSDYEIDNNYDMSGAGLLPSTVHWPFYFMWQWTSVGHLNGYAGNLDCDIAYLDDAGWDRYAGVAAPAPVPTPVPTPVPVDTTPAPVVPTPSVPAPGTTTSGQSTDPIGTVVVSDPTPVIPTPTLPPVVTPVVTAVSKPEQPKSLLLQMWLWLINLFKKTRN